MSLTRIAIILKGYPRLSETFIAREIRALELRGLAFDLVSLRHPTDRLSHPINAEITAPVNYLPEYLYAEPARVLKGLRAAMRLPGFWRAARCFGRDLMRDPTAGRIRRFGQAAVLAGELAPGISHIYAHFLHTPSSVARYTSLMRGATWSFSAHARDIWTIPDWEKREKLAHALWGTTCTAYGLDHLKGLAGARADRVFLSYHGLDLERFPAPPDRAGEPDGHDPRNPVTLVSVGRAVAKKGYDTLLDALALLPDTVHWRFVHIGGGELAGTLKARADALGLGGRIVWQGAQAQSAVIDLLRSGHVFVLASRIDKDGDRDGLPNVLMEAQSQKLVCVSTTVSAIPELISTRETGLLVPPDDPAALAGALARLIENPATRLKLAQAAYRRLKADFAADVCLAEIARRFSLPGTP